MRFHCQQQAAWSHHILDRLEQFTCILDCAQHIGANNQIEITGGSALFDEIAREIQRRKAHGALPCKAVFGAP